MKKNFESIFLNERIPSEILTKLKKHKFDFFDWDYYNDEPNKTYVPIANAIEWFSSRGWDIFYDRYFDFTEGVYSGYQGWVMKTDIFNKKEGETVEFETDSYPTKKEALLAALELAIDNVLTKKKKNEKD